MFIKVILILEACLEQVTFSSVSIISELFVMVFKDKHLVISCHFSIMPSAFCNYHSVLNFEYALLFMIYFGI